MSGGRSHRLRRTVIQQLKMCSIPSLSAMGICLFESPCNIYIGAGFFILFGHLGHRKKKSATIKVNYKTFQFNSHRSGGIVVKVSASQPGGHRFKPRSGHTKDFKNGTHCLLVWRLTCKNGMGKLNTRNYQRTSPLL